MLIIIDEEAIITDKIEEAVVAINQKYSLQNQDINEFLQKVEITGKLFEIKQIIKMLTEITG